MSVNMPTHPRADWNETSMMQNVSFNARRLRRLTMMTALLILISLSALFARFAVDFSSQLGSADTSLYTVSDTAQHTIMIDKTCSPFGALGPCIITSEPPA